MQTETFGLYFTENDSEVGTGKITFKKPIKKSTSSDLNISSSKKKDKGDLDRKLEKDRKKIKKVKNTKLLSFNEDEEDADDG